jgi:hypothetical protein
MRTAKETAAFRAKLVEALEAAQAIADELGDGMPRAGLDGLRANAWPAIWTYRLWPQLHEQQAYACPQ